MPFPRLVALTLSALGFKYRCLGQARVALHVASHDHFSHVLHEVHAAAGGRSTQNFSATLKFNAWATHLYKIVYYWSRISKFQGPTPLITGEPNTNTGTNSIPVPGCHWFPTVIGLIAWEISNVQQVTGLVSSTKLTQSSCTWIHIY
jgi:hypothetical protein